MTHTAAGGVDREDRRGLSIRRGATAADHIDRAAEARGGGVREGCGQAADLTDPARGRVEAEDRATGTRFCGATGDDHPRAGCRDGRIAKTLGEAADDLRCASGPPREDRVERVFAVVAADDVRGVPERGHRDVGGRLRKLPDERYATAAGFIAEDVIVGARTAHRRTRRPRPPSASGLGVVLGFGQSRRCRSRSARPAAGECVIERRWRCLQRPAHRAAPTRPCRERPRRHPGAARAACRSVAGRSLGRPAAAGRR